MELGITGTRLEDTSSLGALLKLPDESRVMASIKYSVITPELFIPVDEWRW